MKVGRFVDSRVDEKRDQRSLFYNVAGSPIGRRSVAGVADSFDVEQFHLVVSADQADNIFDYIYRFCNLSEPNKGFINISKLFRSTGLDLLI